MPEPLTEAQVREALQLLIDAAFGNSKYCARIPADPNHDADLIMGRVVEEWVRLRVDRDVLLAEAKHLGGECMRLDRALSDALFEIKHLRAGRSPEGG